MPKKIVSIAFGVAFVAYGGETAMERRLKRFPVIALQGLRQTSFLCVLLPLVDGVRDGDTFNDFQVTGLSTHNTLDAPRTQPPLRV